MIILLDGMPNEALVSSRAMIASTRSSLRNFRPFFDITSPGIPGDDLMLPNLLPVRRKYLSSFQGENLKASKMTLQILADISTISSDKTEDQVFIQLSCPDGAENHTTLEFGEWKMCSDVRQRARILRSSMFTIIFAPPDDTVSTGAFQLRLSEALKAGAIPVIIFYGQVPHSSLPLSETIDWSQAALLVPAARTNELHFLLRSFSDADIFSMRRQGRLILSTYMSSRQTSLHAIIHSLRERLQVKYGTHEKGASLECIFRF